MYKAIFSDFDGTLVDHDLFLDQRVINAIVDFQDLGYLFTIATGRGYYGNLADAVKAMHIKTPVIIRNGAEIIDPLDHSVIYSKYLESHVAQSIIRYLIKENFEFYVEQGDFTFSVGAKPGKHAPNEQYLNIALLNPIAIPKILIKVQNADDVSRCRQFLESNFSGQISLKVNPIREGDYAIDINSSEVSKAEAVKFLREYLHLDQSEVVAVGDNMNDLPLFEQVGLKVAVGNALPELKARADMITGSVKDLGILDLISKIIHNELN